MEKHPGHPDNAAGLFRDAQDQVQVACPGKSLTETADALDHRSRVDRKLANVMMRPQRVRRPVRLEMRASPQSLRTGELILVGVEQVCIVALREGLGDRKERKRSQHVAWIEHGEEFAACRRKGRIGTRGRRMTRAASQDLSPRMVRTPRLQEGRPRLLLIDDDADFPVPIGLRRNRLKRDLQRRSVAAGVNQQDADPGLVDQLSVALAT